MSGRASKILELNERHPLNRLALQCLVGAPIDHEGELGLLALVSLWWAEGTRPRTQLGTPSESEIASVLTFLRRTEPDATMQFLTQLGDHEAYSYQQLHRLDGEDIAAEVINFIAYKLAMGAALPAPGFSTSSIDVAQL